MQAQAGDARSADDDRKLPTGRDRPMQEPVTERRPSRPTGFSFLRAAVALTAVAILLAACGGDAGPSGGGTGYTLHTLIVNASPADVVVSYTGASPADDITLKTCSAELLDFPLGDPFVIDIDGETVIDTDIDLPDGLPNEGQSDLIVEIDISKDGAKSFDRVRPGSGLTKPGKSSYCPTLPG
jgi:hypothetical protein